MTPFSTTPPIIYGSKDVGGKIILPTYKEQYKYWTFLFVKRKRRALNRYFTRGGIDYPYCMWSNEAMPHRHNFRIKRMKREKYWYNGLTWLNIQDIRRAKIPF